MPTEPSAEVRAQLAEATKARKGSAGQSPAVAPPPPRDIAARAHAGNASAPSGSANAQYLLVDHFFGGSSGTFWAYASGAWHGATTTEPGDEQGIAQVAFASNQVEADWADSGELTLVRCWKFL